MKLATLGGLVFMVLGLPVAMAQAMPFPQEGPSCPLPGDEMVKPFEKAGVEEQVSPLSCGAQPCLDPGDGGGGGGGSSLNPVCFLVCRQVCRPVVEYACRRVGGAWSCEAVSRIVCTEVCQNVCR